MSERLPLGAGPLLVSFADYDQLMKTTIASSVPMPSSIQIIPCEAMERGQAAIITKSFDPFKVTYEPKWEPAEDMFRVRLYSRPGPMCMLSRIFLPSIGLDWTPRKLSRRKQKQETLRALFHRKHSQRKVHT